MHRANAPGYGALVVSLDFELLWGLRDQLPPDGGYYRERILGARRAIPRMLALFEEFDVAATWATVGCLFATSRRELEDFYPAVLPTYANPQLAPIGSPVGSDEDDDPLHFAPSLIAAIRRTPRQEIATHTFSHYYCLAPGQTKQAFQADLDSAIAIAKRHDVQLRSIVFPRNQVNPEYLDVLVKAGIRCYRGNERGRMYRAANEDVGALSAKRAARLADAYVNLGGTHLGKWEEVQEESGLCNVPSSRFLRPYSPRLRHLEPLRRRRIVESMKTAARTHQVFHLWWHPHNFGGDLDENMALLRQILETFVACRDMHGMRSMTMADVAEAVDG